MSDMSTYLGNKVVRWLAGQEFPSAPAGLFLALFDGDPKGAGSEVTTTIRAAGRVEIDLEAAPGAGTDNTIQSDADADFGAADGPADVDHLAVFDADSGGNRLFSKAITPLEIGAGELVRAVAGDLVFTIGD